MKNNIISFLKRKIKKQISSIYIFAIEYIVRYKWLKGTYKNMINNYEYIKPLSSTQKKELKKEWGRYAKSKSFLILNQYISENEKISDYIPMEYYLFKLDPYLNKYEAKFVDDKNYYDLLFPDIRQPKTILRQINGILLDDKYNVVTNNDLLNIVSKYDRIVIKEATFSVGGHGVYFWTSNEGKDKFLKKMSVSNNTIAQEFVTQHEVMGKLNKSSINTLRIASLFVDGETHIITQFVRMGCVGELVDNVSSGGMYCGIDENGCLKEYGYDHLGMPCKVHPSGIVFKDFVIPNYKECIEIVKRLTPRMSNLSKLQSWDIAISENEKPLLIEPNFAYPDILVNQIACGPLFGTGELKNKMKSIVK